MRKLANWRVGEFGRKRRVSEETIQGKGKK
jgi:hypothetical protein